MLAALYLSAALHAASLTEIINSRAYWPPECVRMMCVLSGPGGIVSAWTAHVRRNRDAVFVVRGVCASACFEAVREALRIGAVIIMEPGAKLIKHQPTTGKW